MQPIWRRLNPTETDHELVWLIFSVGSLALAASWFALGLPWPRCVFHELTGLPCMTCGMTRCAVQFFHGHLLAAMKWNPLVFAALLGLVAFDLYAIITLATRAPRLRIGFCTHRAKTIVRLSVVAALAVNWIYLLSHWRDF